MGKSSELVGIPPLYELAWLNVLIVSLVLLLITANLLKVFSPCFTRFETLRNLDKHGPSQIWYWNEPRLDGLYQGSYKALIWIPINQPVFHGSCQLKSPRSSHNDSFTCFTVPGGTGWFRNGRSSEILRWVNWMYGINRFCVATVLNLEHGIRPFCF